MDVAVRDEILCSFARGRCYACDWPFREDGGCQPFNCAFRPSERHPFHSAWLGRMKEMEAQRQLLIGHTPIKRFSRMPDGWVATAPPSS